MLLALHLLEQIPETYKQQNVVGNVSNMSLFISGARAREKVLENLLFIIEQCTPIVITDQKKKKKEEY